MKIGRIELIPHLLQRKVRWQTASYSADSLQLFYVKLTSSVPRRPSSCRPRLPSSRNSDGDLVEGLEVIEGAIRLPAGPGLVNLTV
jgi:hypothetical protein